ncbi:ParB/RepB/Spo0J family partition protein [Calditerrivibrio nitroreducens]|uniref:ParB-like partition protein n=1 Tax=Calditerrivibrio nitroreducens (strain DSM 19672 / NBRC 101217 / Yu37-1) TaxID=768670 RepID=E4TKA9_CALNY|nr:ParB/RepB/Spo0J family partition protein [Calditerrivibrio nitroreducens]ADR19981.1 parB-like partition protein [Calditerrivibrio nitroreducens DSM 19672]
MKKDNMFNKSRATNILSGDLYQTNMVKVPIDKIVADEQIRKKFDEKGIEELAESIKKYGLINPILVELDDKTQMFKIIAGERRYLACKKLGINKITVHVLGSRSENEKKIMQFEENVRREDLTLYEKSTAIFELMQDFLAEKVGIDKSIDNILSELIKINDGKSSLNLKVATIKEDIEKYFGMSLMSIIYLLYPLSFNIDHIKYMHEANIPITIFLLFISVKNDKEFIEECLDKYLEGKINAEKIKRLVSGKKDTNQKTEVKKRIRILQNIKTAVNNFEKLKRTLEDENIIIREKDKVRNEIERLKRYINEIELKLKEDDNVV